MKVQVDWSECEGNAMCMAAAPDIFDVDDDGQMHVLELEQPEVRRDDIERAIRSCPKAALSLIRIDRTEI